MAVLLFPNSVFSEVLYYNIVYQFASGKLTAELKEDAILLCHE